MFPFDLLPKDLGVRWLSCSKFKYNIAVKWISSKLDCLGSNLALLKLVDDL